MAHLGRRSFVLGAGASALTLSGCMSDTATAPQTGMPLLSQLRITKTQVAPARMKRLLGDRSFPFSDAQVYALLGAALQRDLVGFGQGSRSAQLSVTPTFLSLPIGGTFNPTKLETRLSIIDLTQNGTQIEGVGQLTAYIPDPSEDAEADLKRLMASYSATLKAFLKEQSVGA